MIELEMMLILFFYSVLMWHSYWNRAPDFRPLFTHAYTSIKAILFRNNITHFLKATVKWDVNQERCGSNGFFFHSLFSSYTRKKRTCITCCGVSYGEVREENTLLISAMFHTWLYWFKQGGVPALKLTEQPLMLPAVDWWIVLSMYSVF